MDAVKPSRRLNNPVILVCDLQEKFRAVTHEFDKVIFTTQKILRFAEALSIPWLVTTQNRPRLGDTASELQQYVKSPLCKADIDKTRFSMWIPDIINNIPTSDVRSSRRVDRPGGATIVIVGIESHICVTQTALDALADGRHTVYVLADGVSSCNKEEIAMALARLRAEGAIVTTSESWMYELVGDAATPEFKSIIKIVKESVPDTKAALAALLSMPMSKM